MVLCCLQEAAEQQVPLQQELSRLTVLLEEREQAMAAMAAAQEAQQEAQVRGVAIRLLENT